MEYLIQQPRGSKDLLPPIVRKKRKLQHITTEVFEKWGYEEIIPPSFEYLDIYAACNYPKLNQNLFKFFDQDAKAIVLRPDITTSIARIAATHYLEHDTPLRFFYNLNVFRSQEIGKDKKQEFFQIGCELIGLQGIEGDVETILLASEIMNCLGIRDFIINIGHAKFLEGLIDELGHDTYKQMIIQGILEKNFVYINKIIEEIPTKKEVKRFFLSMDKLYGGIEVLDRLKEFSLNEKCEKSIKELEQFIDILSNCSDIKITIDPCLVRNLDYYTGIVFEVYSPKVGYPLGGGGRYDAMFSSLNNGKGATGFAFNEDILLHLVDFKDDYNPQIVLYDGTSYDMALEFSEKLRKQNTTVKMLPIKYLNNICNQKVIYFKNRCKQIRGE